MPKAGAIENALNVEQLQEFTHDLMSRPKVTLKVIQEAFEKATGETVSHEAARTYKKNVYQREIERLKKAEELALHLQASAETGQSITDATGNLLAQEMFEFVLKGDFDLKDMDRINRMYARFKLVDQRDAALEAKLKESEAKLKEFELKNAKLQKEADSVKDVVEDRKLTEEEKQNRIKEILGIPV